MPPEGPSDDTLRLSSWTDRSVVALALIAIASGFAQFGAVAALGDVAKAFGHVAQGATIADQAGLSGTQLGLGLAVIRLASLGGLPLAALADRLGRRGTLLAVTGSGLALTALAALSPSYWWFVAIFALGRPFLSATNTLAQLMASEQTGHRDRTKAIALVTAGYGIGAGITAVIHSLGHQGLGFRGVFALSLVPLGLLFVIGRRVKESDRFRVSVARRDGPLPVFGFVSRRFRWRLGIVALVTFTISFVTGPANSFVFLYAQDFVHQRGGVTAIMVVGAGVTGLAGLLAGRWAADRLGRRVTAVAGVLGIVGFGVLAYTGSAAGLIAGYVLGVLAASMLAPALGALVNELFPTEVRATAGGWCLAAGVAGAVVGLVVFGAVADVGHRFAFSAIVTFLPASACVLLFLALPETRGREPEQLTAASTAPVVSPR